MMPFSCKTIQTVDHVISTLLITKLLSKKTCQNCFTRNPINMFLLVFILNAIQFRNRLRRGGGFLGSSFKGSGVG